MKKLISLFLISIIIISDVVCNTIASTIVQADFGLNIGDYVQLGKYYDEPILWRCVDIDENGPLMLADKILTIKPFDAKGTHTYMDGTPQEDSSGYRTSYGSNLWETSNMRSWLNSTATAGNVTWSDGCPPTETNVLYGYNDYATEKGFIADSNFTTGERGAIKSVTQKSLIHPIDVPKLKVGGTVALKYDTSISTVVQNYDTAYYHNVTDKIFILDVKQINKVYQNLGESYYIGKPTQKAVDNSEFKDSDLSTGKSWGSWLRSPYASSIPLYVRYVNSDGDVDSDGADNHFLGVRPAFYIDLLSMNFKSGNGSEVTPYILTTSFDFKGSSLGSDPNNIIFSPYGGQHNLTAIYQNTTDELQNTVFIVAVKKNSKVISVYTMEHNFLPYSEFTFNPTIDIPATTDSANVEVDFYLWDGLGSMKTKHDTVKNSINNVR